MKKKMIMISLLALCCFTSCEPTNTTVEWTRTIQKNEVLTICTSKDYSTYSEGTVFTAYKDGEYDVVTTESYSSAYTLYIDFLNVYTLYSTFLYACEIFDENRLKIKLRCRYKNGGIINKNYCINLHLFIWYLFLNDISQFIIYLLSLQFYFHKL